MHDGRGKARVVKIGEEIRVSSILPRIKIWASHLGKSLSHFMRCTQKKFKAIGFLKFSNSFIDHEINPTKVFKDKLHALLMPHHSPNHKRINKRNNKKLIKD